MRLVLLRNMTTKNTNKQFKIKYLITALYLNILNMLLHFVFRNVSTIFNPY